MIVNNQNRAQACFIVRAASASCICLLFILPEAYNANDRHVQGDQIANEEADSTRWLPDRVDGIDDRVQETNSRENAEQHDGNHGTGIGECVEQANGQEW